MAAYGRMSVALLFQICGFVSGAAAAEACKAQDFRQISGMVVKIYPPSFRLYDFELQLHSPVCDNTPTSMETLEVNRRSQMSRKPKVGENITAYGALADIPYGSSFDGFHRHVFVVTKIVF